MQTYELSPTAETDIKEVTRYTLNKYIIIIGCCPAEPMRASYELTQARPDDGRTADDDAARMSAVHANRWVGLVCLSMSATDRR